MKSEAWIAAAEKVLLLADRLGSSAFSGDENSFNPELYNDERHRPANAGITLDETAKALELLVQQEIPATEINSRLRNLLERMR